MDNYDNSQFMVVTNADIDTIEDIVEVRAGGLSRLLFSFVIGTANLSNFQVTFKAHPDGDDIVMATAAGDYTTPTYPVIKASGDLNGAASGATVHWILLDISTAHSVKIQAAGTSSTLAGHLYTN